MTAAPPAQIQTHEQEQMLILCSHILEFIQMAFCVHASVKGNINSGKGYHEQGVNSGKGSLYTNAILAMKYQG